MSESRADRAPVTPNPDNPAPAEILRRQVPVIVRYLGFDAATKSGVIEVAEDVARQVRLFFAVAREVDFPIEKIVRASDKAYLWDDEKLMADNASSGFNYRNVAGSNQPSKHGLGLALDINPRLNPYIRYQNGEEIMAPAGAIWNQEIPGTLYAEHPLVEFMTNIGWEWGGNWSKDSGRIDYQHFEKI